MTPINTLKAIRALCENAPDPRTSRSMDGWVAAVHDFNERINRIYRLCLDALEPAKPEETVQSYTLDEATIKAQRESWAKGDMD